MQITYFPYLALNSLEIIPFGDIKVWNFGKKAQEFIPNEQLRDKVKRLLESNVKNEKVFARSYNVCLMQFLIFDK